jgi:hypothetical protein
MQYKQASPLDIIDGWAWMFDGRITDAGENN